MSLRPSLTTAVVAAFVLSASLAGCFGKGDKKQDVTDPSASPTFDELTGAVQGLVMSEEGYPLENAQVGFVGDAARYTTTGADGGFVFSNVEPGTYSLQATRIGYATVARSIEVLPAEVTTVDFSLAAQQVPGLPYSVSLEPVKGRISCAWAFHQDGVATAWANCKVLGGDPESPHEVAWTAATGGDSNLIDLESLFSANRVLASDTLRSVVMEVDWVPTSAAAASLELSLEKLGDRDVSKNGSDAAIYANAYGTPGFQLLVSPGTAGPYASGTDNAEALDPATSGATIAVVPRAAQDPAVAPLQQDFQVWITLFYNSPAPADYHILTDG